MVNPGLIWPGNRDGSGKAKTRQRTKSRLLPVQARMTIHQGQKSLTAISV